MSDTPSTSASVPATSLWPNRITKHIGVIALVTLVVFAFGSAHPARAEGQGGFREEAITFTSGDVTLHGTVLIPDGPGDAPALALVHGAGPHTREATRAEAEAFARLGVAALIYDKRTDGYSQFERSYDLLADDALAAVRALRAHPGVDPDAVGLWGLSEGAWVVPLAAARADEVAFAVLVAATGVPPVRQHAWALENQLHRQGVSGSMVDAVARMSTRLLVGADLFAEANHDPVGSLERVRQPVLALWGQKDRVEPAAESAGIVRDALERGGNHQYTFRFFPDAEHGLRTSADGFDTTGPLAPGYPETVAAWVQDFASGAAPGPSVDGPTPEQARPSRPLPPLAWWESPWVHLGAMAIPMLAFAAYLLIGRRALRCGHGGALPRLRLAGRWLAVGGLLTILGFVGYLGYVLFTGATAVGPVVTGRALPWLTLQVLTVGTAVCAVALAATAWSARGSLGRAARVWVSLLLSSSAVFLMWAGYWGLPVP